MKKVATILVGILVTIALTGCTGVEGIDPRFYSKAQAIFAEIDDDTMEMELSDKDDILNFELLQGTAVTEKEEKISAIIQQMVDLQPKVTNGDKGSFAPYLKLRNSYYNIMEIDNLSRKEFVFVEDK